MMEGKTAGHTIVEYGPQIAHAIKADGAINHGRGATVTRAFEVRLAGVTRCSSELDEMPARRGSRKGNTSRIDSVVSGMSSKMPYRLFEVMERFRESSSARESVVDRSHRKSCRLKSLANLVLAVFRKAERRLVSEPSGASVHMDEEGSEIGSALRGRIEVEGTVRVGEVAVVTADHDTVLREANG